MRFKPVAFPQGYGQAPSLTAWGGGAIFDGKQYHAYIHTIANGCPLACGSNSRIEHGVSENATGPSKARLESSSAWRVFEGCLPVAVADRRPLFHTGIA